LLRGTCEYITTPDDFKVVKSSCSNNHVKLYVQQSARNSACPQIDVSLRSFWDRLLNQDVADLNSSAWLEHPPHFRENC
jgi:hypothetical protein